MGVMLGPGKAMSEPMKGNVWVDESMDKGKDEYMNE